MMRTLEIRCDNCGTVRPAACRPRTWWVLEQQSEVITTGALDFCSLPCLGLWVASPEVGSHQAYAADFAPREVDNIVPDGQVR